MRGNKGHDSLDAAVDRALAVSANIEPPAGMEKRIIEKIGQKRAKAQRTMKIAGLALAAVLVGTAVHRPIDSAPPETTEAGLNSAPPVETVVAVLNQAVDVPAPERAEAPVPNLVDTFVEEEGLAADAEEESLISDFELEPLNIAALELPVLSSR